MAMNGTISLSCWHTDGGFNKEVQIAEGTTIGEVFAAEEGFGDPAEYKVLLNGVKVDMATGKGTILRDGDRISITPVKITGAKGYLLIGG